MSQIDFKHLFCLATQVIAQRDKLRVTRAANTADEKNCGNNAWQQRVALQLPLIYISLKSGSSHLKICGNCTLIQLITMLKQTHETTLCSSVFKILFSEQIAIALKYSMKRLPIPFEYPNFHK